MDYLNAVKRELDPIVSRLPRVIAVYLFGSSVRSGELVRDLDICVLTSLTSARETEAYEELIAQQIGMPLGLKLDITLFPSARALSPKQVFFCFRAVHDGTLLYVRDLDELGDYLEPLARRYADLRPRYRRARDEVLESVRP